MRAENKIKVRKIVQELKDSANQNEKKSTSLHEEASSINDFYEKNKEKIKALIEELNHLVEFSFSYDIDINENSLVIVLAYKKTPYGFTLTCSAKSLEVRSSVPAHSIKKAEENSIVIEELTLETIENSIANFYCAYLEAHRTFFGNPYDQFEVNDDDFLGTDDDFDFIDSDSS